MPYYSKLRWSIGFYYPVVIFSSYILAILEIMLRNYLIREGYEISHKPWIAYILVGLFFILMGIIQWFKYRLWIYPVLGLIIGVLCLNAIVMFGGHDRIYLATYLMLIIILILFIILNWKKLYGQERFELNSRRVFRLAAELINETGDGFTERPFSAGEADFKKDDLVGFSRFVNGKYIARPFHYDDRIVFGLSMNRSLFSTDEPKDVSYVTFHFNGSITVVIAENDYREYVARFNFDRLCDSLAVVFKRFLEYYKQGMEQRIITELKTAR